MYSADCSEDKFADSGIITLDLNDMDGEIDSDIQEENLTYNDSDSDYSSAIGEPKDTENHLYAGRDRKSPIRWYVASNLQSTSGIKIATNDELKLPEIKSATPKERDLWRSAIEEESISP